MIIVSSVRDCKHVFFNLMISEHILWIYYSLLIIHKLKKNVSQANHRWPQSRGWQYNKINKLNSTIKLTIFRHYWVGRGILVCVVSNSSMWMITYGFEQRKSIFSWLYCNNLWHTSTVTILCNVHLKAASNPLLCTLYLNKIRIV